jgi:hypothetical protein
METKIRLQSGRCIIIDDNITVPITKILCSGNGLTWFFDGELYVGLESSSGNFDNYRLARVYRMKHAPTKNIGDLSISEWDKMIGTQSELLCASDDVYGKSNWVLNTGKVLTNNRTPWKQLFGSGEIEWYVNDNSVVMKHSYSGLFRNPLKLMRRRFEAKIITDDIPVQILMGIFIMSYTYFA